MRKSTDSKEKRIKLSSVVGSSQIEQKMSFANRQISVIDILSPKFQGVKIIYLSQNFISDIKNLVQFPNLKVLSLSYNQIRTFDSISVLSTLKHLQILNLGGNPICRNILYSCYVIGSCKNSLIKFDNIDVKKQQISFYQSMKVEIQQQFKDLIHNYNRLFDIYRKIGSNYQSKKQQYKWQCLYQDCFQIYNQIKSNKNNKEEIFLEAMDDLKTRQSHKIAELLQSEQLEEKQQLFQDIDQCYQSSFLILKNLFQYKLSIGFETLRNFSVQIQQKSVLLSKSLIKQKFMKFFKLMATEVASNRSRQITLKTSKQLKIKIQQKLLKKKYLKMWRTQYTNYLIQKECSFLYGELKQFKQKESRYVHKINLLQQLIEINKQKRKSFSNFETRNSEGSASNKQNTPSRLNSSRIVRQKLNLRQSNEKYNSMIKKKLG